MASRVPRCLSHYCQRGPLCRFVSCRDAVALQVVIDKRSHVAEALQKATAVPQFVAPVATLVKLHLDGAARVVF